MAKAGSPLKEIARDLCPPAVWRGLSGIKAKVVPSMRRLSGHPSHQDLGVYWDDEMAAILETWGNGNVWNEIQFLLFDQQGKVLDIACGTGKTMELLTRYPKLDLTGFDISDMLIGKAKDRGLAADKLFVADATALRFADGEFDFAYSIGSLEHFTEQGMVKAIAESGRVVKRCAFHMVPVARSGRDEGWMKTYQSFFNNSVEWWLAKYHASFHRVDVLDSAWEDNLSVGKWFICHREGTR